MNTEKIGKFIAQKRKDKNYTQKELALKLGVHELNFCVRDGNRWTLMTINTNFCGWLLTISMSNASQHLTA